GPAEGPNTLGRSAPSDDAGIRRGLAEPRHDPSKHRRRQSNRLRRRQRRHEPRKRQQADELHVNRAQDAATHQSVRARPRANVDLHASILRYLVLNTLARKLHALTPRFPIRASLCSPRLPPCPPFLAEWPLFHPLQRDRGDEVGHRAADLHGRPRISRATLCALSGVCVAHALSSASSAAFSRSPALSASSIFLNRRTPPTPSWYAMLARARCTSSGLSSSHGSSVVSLAHRWFISHSSH